eukprot:scaffold116430_cov63-Phaeocystis_antarctica.AAC.3
MKLTSSVKDSAFNFCTMFSDSQKARRRSRRRSRHHSRHHSRRRSRRAVQGPNTNPNSNPNPNPTLTEARRALQGPQLPAAQGRAAQERRPHRRLGPHARVKGAGLRASVPDLRSAPEHRQRRKVQGGGGPGLRPSQGAPQAVRGQ